MFMHPATQRPYSPQMVRRLHNEIIKEAGLDHIRFADGPAKIGLNQKHPTARGALV